MTADNWNDSYCLMDMLDNKALKQMTAIRDKIIRSLAAETERDERLRQVDLWLI